MITDNQGGISCLNCGHEEVFYTKAELHKLIDKLKWTLSGDVICPECGHATTFEDYIDD